MANTKFYLVMVHGLVEPEVIGDYPSMQARDQMALTIHSGENTNFSKYGVLAYNIEDDSIFALDVIDGVPSMWAYSGGFFEFNGEGDWGA